MVTLAVKLPSAFSEPIISAIVWPSRRSTSVKPIVPLSLKLAAALTNSVTAPVSSLLATIGRSLVPVSVIVIIWSTKAPNSSVTRAV